jgi:hypothetical protein
MSFCRLSSLLVIVLVSTLGWSDGSFFTLRKEVQPNIPIQRAFIGFAKGEETLIVETTLNAPKGDYAWIIPTPSVPSSVTPCAPHALSGLVEATTPQIVDVGEEYNLYLLLPSLIPLIACLILLRAYRGKPGRVKNCLIWGGLIATFAYVLMATFFPVFAGPKTVKAKSDPVVQTGVAGSYAYFNLSSSKAEEIVGWLSKNGFVLPTNAQTVIENYAKQGWGFTALRYHQRADGSSSSHPIRLVFKTAKPIYPMALTGTATDRLRLDLVVAMDEQARVTGMHSLLCTKKLGYAHPDIEPMLQGQVVTRLRGDLTSVTLDKDMDIESVPYSGGSQERWFTSRGLLNVLLVVFLILLPVVLVIVTAITLSRNGSFTSWAKNLGITLVILAFFGLLKSLSVQIVEAEYAPPRAFLISIYKQRTHFIEQLEGQKAVVPLRQQVVEGMTHPDPDGRAIGDVPGGYDLLTTPTSIQVTLYDAQNKATVYKITQARGKVWVQREPPERPAK